MYIVYILSYVYLCILLFLSISYKKTDISVNYNFDYCIFEAERIRAMKKRGGHADK